MLGQQVTDEENYTFMTKCLDYRRNMHALIFVRLFRIFRYANKEDQLIQGYTMRHQWLHSGVFKTLFYICNIESYSGSKILKLERTHYGKTKIYVRLHDDNNGVHFLSLQLKDCTSRPVRNM